MGAWVAEDTQNKLPPNRALDPLLDPAFRVVVSEEASAAAEVVFVVGFSASEDHLVAAAVSAIKAAEALVEETIKTVPRHRMRRVDLVEEVRMEAVSPTVGMTTEDGAAMEVDMVAAEILVV